MKARNKKNEKVYDVHCGNVRRGVYSKIRKTCEITGEKTCMQKTGQDSHDSGSC